MFRHPSGRPLCLLYFVLALSLGGCADSDALPDAPRLPSLDERAKFGTVGVTAARFAPQDVYLTDAVIGKGAGAAGGAAEGAGEGALRGLYEGLKGCGESARGDPAGVAVMGVLCLFVVVPLFTVGGAMAGGIAGGIEGADQAVSKDDAKRIEACIAEVLLDPEIQRKAQRQILLAAERETSHPVVAVDDVGPILPQVTVSYGRLADRGIDTVLEVSVLNAGLAGGHEDEVSLQPFLMAEVRLVRVADDVELFRRTGWYGAEHQPLVTLCAADGRLLRAALDRIYTTMAEAIVEDVFLTWRPGGDE